MRFVPISCIKEGMINGKTIYGKNGEVMLHDKVEIKQEYIEKIANLGYSGIYILDDISKDIEVVDIIKNTLKINTVQQIKDVYIKTACNDSNDKNFNKILLLAENIVDEILQNKNAVFNLMDLKVYDEYTFYHSVNVAVLSIIVATELGLSKEELIKLGISGLLHDIGKVFVKKEILNKKGKLSESEFREIKEHPVNGFNYLKKSCQIPLKSYVGVLQHHEKYDGTGYPYGLKGREISLFGRILTIADIYDALISDRPYRQGILPSEAMEYIMGGGGTYFDPEISTVFVKKLALYPVGTCVELSNGMIGIVCQNYEGYSIRPDIKVFQNKDRKIKPFIIKLQKQINITITSVVKNDILAAM